MEYNNQNLHENQQRRPKSWWSTLLCACRVADRAGSKREVNSIRRKSGSRGKRSWTGWWRMGSGDGLERARGNEEQIGDLQGIVNGDADPPPEHLVILVNGIIGSPEDWRYAAERFRTKLGGRAAIHCSANNASRQTFDGVDVMGKRLAKEVREIIDKAPGVTKISFVAHSLGGLVARYAIAQLYCPPVRNEFPATDVNNPHLNNKMTTEAAQSGFTIGGLQPENFVTLATPHLGCRGTEQLPFLWGIEAFEQAVSCCAHWFVGQTGKHLFLTDGSNSELPLLRKMVTDCKEGQFISSLQIFKKRIAYANVMNDQMVGWRTSSIRFTSEMPKKLDGPVDPAYPHIVGEEDPVVPVVEDLSVVNSTPPLSNGSKYNEDLYEEEIVRGLTQLPWHRVDVSFGGFQAHNLIQVKNPKAHYEGRDVIEHVLDKHFIS